MELLERHPWIGRPLTCPRATEVLEVLERGAYSAGGESADVSAMQRAAESGTVLHEPEELGGLRAGDGRSGAGAAKATDATEAAAGLPAITVTDETTQDAAYRLHDRGSPPVVLNFAAGRNPGGGFLRGSRAQEEDLCRCSGLFPALLRARGYYEANRADRTARHTDHVIHSPAVPFLRRRGRDPFEAPPRPVSVITSAAPVATVLHERGTYDETEVRAIFRRRWANVLAVAARHGHRVLVLGAWGCGAFGNDAGLVAREAQAAIDASPHAGGFDELVFAIPDHGPVGHRNHVTFRTALLGG